MCMVQNVPRHWIKWLPLAEYWYNTNYHTSLKLTLFQALCGYSTSSLSLGPYLDSPNVDASAWIHQHNQMAELVKDNLYKAQERMKFFADKHRKERSFVAGDFVYLKLQSFRQNSFTPTEESQSIF